MDFNLPANIEYCRQFVESYSSILYYSHIPTALTGLLLGFFIFYKNRTLLSKILLAITITFAIWSALDLLIWFNYDHASIVMFAWSNIEIFSVLLFLLCLYFIDVFCTKEDVLFGRKLFFAAIFAPVAIFSSTSFYLNGFDLQECTALENTYYIEYTFYLKIIIAAYVICFGIYRYFKADKGARKQIAIILSGMVGFIFIFFATGYISERTLNYTYEMYGLFGMPLFLGFLAYLIVKFKAFQIRVVSAQALVIALTVLIFSQYFFLSNLTSQVLNSITAILSVIFGYILIINVKKEIKTREHLQMLTSQLQRLNTDLSTANTKLKFLDQQKTEFISFATHQLRSPLTAIRGNASLILDGDMGPVPKKIRESVETIFTSINTQIRIVEDYLNVSRIELGTMNYSPMKVDLKVMLNEVMIELQPNFDERHLASNVVFDVNETYYANVDIDKFKQVIMNVIDNSIKYTPSGSITAILEKDTAQHVIRLRVVDTGVGIKPEVLPKLFQKFVRAPHASDVNIHGTGLGLYLAKEIVQGHNGRIWAESEGDGKGSRFIVEVPEVF